MILSFDYLFSYHGEKTEKTHKAKVIFEKVVEDEVAILVFNDTLQGAFEGRGMSLEVFQNTYKKAEFEVIVETYNWGKAVLQGWLWIKNKPVTCIMTIIY